MLYQRQIKFGVLFPAKLWVTFKDQQYYLDTPEDEQRGDMRGPWQVGLRKTQKLSIGMLGIKE